ncbi:hypothetical protein NE237_000052 [Protea cynaroides]|uniref:Uncharacterized protein n=1 Tax=Protea cynaroides TaxID=273540 RepID=A0A9Q0GNV0_9MAGN|nr:hypothetical protein NE237_000052 [Protea cynaroides]
MFTRSCRGAEDYSAVRFTRAMPMCRGVDECSTSGLLGHAKVLRSAKVLSRRGMLHGQVYLVMPMFREMLIIQVYSVMLKCRGVEEFSAVRCTRSCRFAVGSMSAPLSGLRGHAEVPSSVPWLGLINHAEMSSALWSLQGNSLMGKITEVIGLMQALAVLDSNKNELVRPIPLILGNLNYTENSPFNRISASCKALNQFNLNCSRLSGSIPSSFRNLMSLIYLKFSSNSFKGKTPVQLGRIVNRDTPDLSNNDFSRPILASLGALEHLLTFDNSTNIQAGFPKSRVRCRMLLPLFLTTITFVVVHSVMLRRQGANVTRNTEVPRNVVYLIMARCQVPRSALQCPQSCRGAEDYSTVRFTWSCRGTKSAMRSGLLGYAEVLRSAPRLGLFDHAKSCRGVEVLWSVEVQKSALWLGLHGCAEVPTSAPRSDLPDHAEVLRCGGVLCGSAPRLSLLRHAEVSRSALWLGLFRHAEVRSCRGVLHCLVYMVMPRRGGTETPRGAARSSLLGHAEEPSSSPRLCLLSHAEFQGSALRSGLLGHADVLIGARRSGLPDQTEVPRSVEVWGAPRSGVLGHAKVPPNILVSPCLLLSLTCYFS